jgi:NADH-quinone oxidoreductase subunit G
MLPIAPFTETSGTFINTEGRVQSFNAVSKSRGETRPAWKVLRVLGNLLGLPGFDYNNTEQVRAELLPSGETKGLLDNTLKQLCVGQIDAKASGIERIGEVPIYQLDALVRRAPSLQQTKDAQAPQAWVNGALLQQLGIKVGDTVQLKQGSGQAQLAVACDDRLPNNCVRVAGAHALTMHLGGLFGPITVERA